MTIRELLDMEISVDVYDNVCDEIGIAFEGPIKLTEEGKLRFAPALKLQVEELTDCVAIIDVDAPDWEQKLRDAKALFYSIAGYCSSKHWDEWFEEEV